MAEPLLGVILATSSSRGEHVVFRWPNNPKLFKRYSKVKYYTEARPSHLNRLDDDLDPVRQKAKWDRHDEDDDDHADGNTDGAGQSDTPSSSDVEDSDGTMADDDENRSVRDRAETVASHGRSKTGASASANRSKSKVRRGLMGMEEASPSVRSGDRHNGAHKDAGDAHDKAPESDTGTSKELSPEEKAKREERAARAYKTYLGYDIELLASILNPRQELTHHKFELMIDDLAFLGHPVSLDRSDILGGQDDEDADAEGHDRSAGQRGRSGLRKEIRPYDVSDGGDASKDAACSLRQNGGKTEAAAPTKARNASQTRMEQTSDSSVSRSYAPLTQFHLVLVLDRPDPSTAMHGMDISSWLQLFYDNIIFKMTSALFAEQRESDYIGRETEKLLALRERCMDDGQAYAAYAAQCLGISSLARCIRDLYKSISTSSDAFLTINDNIEVHLQLPPILQDPSNLLKTVDIETDLDKNDPIFLSGGGFSGLGKEGQDEDGGGGTHDRLLGLEPNQLSFEEWCRTTGPYLLPWKTLLLLHDHADPGRDRNTAGSSSPSGALSPSGQAPETHGFEQLTRNFTALFQPNLYHTLNFSDVADMLGWELYEDIYPMVRHLIYYRQARVIDIPKPGHVYAISPLFDFARLGPLSHVWARSFPDVAPLPVFLSQLSSSSRAFYALFPARHQRELALDVLIWLLRREVVVKMHIRLRLIATESVKRRTAERRTERHERHRVRKEKKMQRAAKSEAKRMKKSQSEEQQRRKAAEQAARKEEDEDGRNQLTSKVGLLRLADEGKNVMKQRRISAASERPDLPPPSESADSDHPSHCSCSQHPSLSSEDDMSTSDFSLSSDSSSSTSSVRRRSHLQSPPSSSSVSAASPIHNRAPPSSVSYTASLIVEPSRASRRENEYIATMLEHKDAATVKHFFRLLPYLNGKHTIDEIEYRVKMRRKEIRRLLQTFREFIITFMHP
uniref:Nitrogen permease regulator 3 n=1 Tax=Kalmanozyma brasiliensis (strain GHG001) TaxID=1365824 RepID=V5ETE4_KALBG